MVKMKILFHLTNQGFMSLNWNESQRIFYKNLPNLVLECLPSWNKFCLFVFSSKFKKEDSLTRVGARLVTLKLTLELKPHLATQPMLINSCGAFVLIFTLFRLTWNLFMYFPCSALKFDTWSDCVPYCSCT